MKVLRVPVVCSTCWGLPARCSIQGPVSSQPLLRQRRPAFPRRLMSWSGLPTSFELKTHSGRPAPGLMGGWTEPVAGSLHVSCAAHVGHGHKAWYVLSRRGERGTYNWTWATWTGATVDSVLQGMGVGERVNQYEMSCLASYSRIADA